MKTKVIHEPCGNQVGWFLGDRPKIHDYMKSADYMRLDESQPAFCEYFNEYCPFCKKSIQPGELKRVFKECNG